MKKHRPYHFILVGEQSFMIYAMKDFEEAEAHWHFINDYCLGMVHAIVGTIHYLAMYQNLENSI